MHSYVYWLAMGFGCNNRQYSAMVTGLALLVSSMVILVGLRMGIGALSMWRAGFLEKEFPRYQYQT